MEHTPHHTRLASYSAVRCVNTKIVEVKRKPGKLSVI